MGGRQKKKDREGRKDSKGRENNKKRQGGIDYDYSEANSFSKLKLSSMLRCGMPSSVIDKGRLPFLSCCDLPWKWWSLAVMCQIHRRWACSLQWEKPLHLTSQLLKLWIWCRISESESGTVGGFGLESESDSTSLSGVGVGVRPCNLWLHSHDFIKELFKHKSF